MTPAKYNWQAAWNKPERKPEPAAGTIPAATVNGASAYGQKALDNELAILRSKTPDSHERNNQLNLSAFALAQLVAAGHLPENGTWEQLRATALRNGLPPGETDNTLRSAFRAGLQQPRQVPELKPKISPTWAALEHGGHVNTDTGEIVTVEATTPNESLISGAAEVADWEQEFWNARDELAHIYNFALSRMVSPWAVLGWALEIAIYHIPPWIKLPAIIGRRASLNLFVAFVAPTSIGKGASSGAAEDAFDYFHCDPIHTVPVGSGEGLNKQYAHWETKEGQVWDRNQVLFTAAEVDTLSALKDRNGSTLLSQLRSAYSGEALGFAYSNTQNRIMLPSHSYRLCFAVGVQPKRALPLLNEQEIAGGTPGRFMWMLASDPRISINPPPEPKPRTIEHTKWGRHPTRGYDVEVCDEAVAEIRANHVEKNQGKGDPIDGFTLQTQEKVAVALAVLANRDKEHLQISVEDWELARRIMQKSTQVRGSVQAELTRERKRENEARAMQDGHREVIKGAVVEDHEMQRACQAVTRKLSREGDWVRGKIARDAIPSKLRDLFDEVADKLTEAGQVEVEHVKGTGQEGIRLRLKQGAR